MWVPMTELTIVMLHGVPRLYVTAAGLETASRLNRRKDFPGASGAQVATQQPHPSIPDIWAARANGPCLRPSHHQTYRAQPTEDPLTCIRMRCAAWRCVGLCPTTRDPG